ncbi:MAG: putative lipopolysaccharide heptosyltransferase III [Burkholderiales bacterium]
MATHKTNQVDFLPAGFYPDLSKVRRVLVIKMRNHGDVLLSSPVFDALRKKLPAAQIDAYVYLDTLPMLEGHPAIGQFHLYDRNWKSQSAMKRYQKEYALLHAIRTAGYDLTINLTDGDRGTLSALYSGARIRIGVEASGRGIPGKQRMVTHVAKRPPTSRHMVEQNLDAIRRIGIFPDRDERRTSFFIPGAARNTVAQRLSQHGISGQGYLLIHPTSRWLFKAWPAKHVAALIEALETTDCPVILSCGPDPRERSVLDEIKRFAQHTRIIDLGGMLSLKELGALIERARCLLCVDSVPMHMAAALRVPTVAIFGPSSESIWAPWDNPYATIVSQNLSCQPCGLDGCGGSKRSDCLESLAVEPVLRAVRSKLAATLGP